MAFWVGLWKFCLIAALASFFVMALIVTVGGGFDVRKMLRSLSRDDSE